NSVRRKYTSQRKSVRVGCASGFWGDTATAVPQLLHGGKLDFLVFDYLSEITMSLLTAAKAKRIRILTSVPDIHSFIGVWGCVCVFVCLGVRVVSNAGGVNPLACAAAIQNIVQEAGLSLKVAVVTGDDLMPQKDSLNLLKMAETQEKKPLPKMVHSMNAYLGAVPIKRCLDLGADIVVTGRCVDSALVLGPLMHSFGWEQGNFDLLAAGSLAGHLIECGAQATGGIFTDWHKVPDWYKTQIHSLKFSLRPHFLLKPHVTLNTHPHTWVLCIDPKDLNEAIQREHYRLPTKSDITSAMSGACYFSKLDASSGFYQIVLDVESTKLSTFNTPFGRHCFQRLPFGISSAPEVFHKTVQQLFDGIEGVGVFIDDVVIWGRSKEEHDERLRKDPREAVLWMAVHHKQRKALEFFSREVAPAGTGMAPGLTAIVGGRPRVSPVLKPFFFLHSKADLQVDIHLNGDLIETYRETQSSSPGPIYTPSHIPQHLPTPTDLPSGPHSYRLEELVYTRSGDKGDAANIGVIARHPLYFPYLKRFLTAEVVENFFQHLIKKDGGDVPSVSRYELPGVCGLNFLIRNSLGGGGVASLRSDPQGKAYGQMLLDYRLSGLPDLKSFLD
ncbi:hypothetical protein C0J45_23009, partial [Silurus meridionalis]